MRRERFTKQEVDEAQKALTRIVKPLPESEQEEYLRDLGYLNEFLSQLWRLSPIGKE